MLKRVHLATLAMATGNIRVLVELSQELCCCVLVRGESKSYSMLVRCILADDCASGNVPSGAGFSTNCDGLVTDDAPCTQTCSAGYSDNNSGNGQVYTCDAGSFVGTALTCTGTSTIIYVYIYTYHSYFHSILLRRTHAGWL